MSEKSFIPNFETAPSAEISSLVRIVEGLEAHRAALLWRNFLVRKNELKQVYNARVELARDIRAAVSGKEGQDWSYLKLVLGPDANPESMKQELVSYLRTEYILPAVETSPIVTTPEQLIQLHHAYIQYLNDLDNAVAMLQALHRIHPDVPEILQKLEGLHAVGHSLRGLDIQKAYQAYLKHIHEASVLKTRVEDLLKPFPPNEDSDT